MDLARYLVDASATAYAVVFQAEALLFIAAAMLVALVAIALMGPRTRNLALEQISN